MATCKLILKGTDKEMEAALNKLRKKGFRIKNVERITDGDGDAPAWTFLHHFDTVPN